MSKITLPFMNIIRDMRKRKASVSAILDRLWSYGREEEKRIQKQFEAELNENKRSKKQSLGVYSKKE